MTKAAYIKWCFDMAKAEEHHPKFRDGYLRCAMKAELAE